MGKIFSQTPPERVYRKSDVIILDLVMIKGSVFAVADFTSYRQPAVQVIFVTNTTFFRMARSFVTSRTHARTFPAVRHPKTLRRLSITIARTKMSVSPDRAVPSSPIPG